MDYNYENLDPERFQIFCQSLLNSEFPKFQSFPVGQPDGGRDAISYLNRKSYGDEFNVFQVKFVRKDNKDIFEWLEDTLKKEQKKVTRLIRRGAKEYFLLTNLSGTSHLDKGSMDKVDQILKKYISIPTYCWWREDLNVKLNVNWDLKWVFPELFSPVDLFRIIVESRLKTEDRERRFNAVNLYIADQFDTDSKVKFKQVELQNQLLDLFIDVPISPKSIQSLDYKRNNIYHYLLHRCPDVIYLKEQGYDIPTRHDLPFEEEEGFVGASTFFLDDIVQGNSVPIVLEGGPGQGKSTITQYICQVHRARLLNKESELNKIAKHHLSSSIRIPIKIDLRDFASWINNKNPFVMSNDEHIEVKNKSLDSFIAAHIEHYSGGIDFNVNDLHEIFKVSKVLLVLDGFDEVADINLREEIVSIITKGIKRIKTICHDIQVIITSRPAAFLNSPSFSKDEFDYYCLDSVNSVLIDIYSDKWIKSKQLPQKEGQETKKILKEKLKQPHIKDLAKNPMQLAILISLIHTKGYSLPDKRTAFYDSYIEVFFNRESEKDSTVRKYRDLIIELHQYVAWIIHRDAELGSNGRIRHDSLIELLESYLKEEEHDTAIASRLFDKMAERVVALVSRIEGTFEFEVQPLREYFCAKHLYSTARYSPAGAEKKGTKPDRFDAMAKNFYWLNVLRFYAGCFDKGELPTIIDRLKELSEEGDYKYISHPRELASILLSDWVFAQYPKLMKDVVKVLLDGLGLRTILASELGYRYRSNEISLPFNSGRNEIVDECFKILSTYPPRDYSIELIGIVLSNDNNKVFKIWEEIINNKKGEDLINWLTYGLYLRVLHKVEDSRLLSFFEDKQNLVKKVSVLIQAGKGNFIESIPEITEKVCESILNGKTEYIHTSRLESFISIFWRIFEPNLYYSIVHTSDNFSCLKILNRFSYFEDSMNGELKVPKSTFLGNKNSNNYYKLLYVIHNELYKPTKSWNTSFEPWENILEKGRELFGERITFYNLSSIGASIKLNVEDISEDNSLYDKKLSLIKRARFARLRSKNINWWQKQILNSKNDDETYLCLLIMIMWASTSVISKLINEVSSCIQGLSDIYFETLYKNLKRMCFVNNQNSNYKNYNCLINDIKTLKILGLKLQGKNLVDFKNKYLNSYDGDDINILEMLQEVSLGNVINNIEVEKNLKNIRNCYTKGVLNERNIFDFYFMRHQHMDFKINKEYARIVLKEPSLYPRVVVRASEISLKNYISKDVKSVKNISIEEKWF